MKFRTRKREEIGLDLTPIVDTVFNLLIFFALSLNFIVLPGINIKLPKAKTQDLPSEKREANIVITKDNRIFLNRKLVSINNLSLRLKSILKSNKSIIIIQADENVLHGKVVEVMDIIRSSGFSKIAIATSPKER
jgi:biopolymer transport protein ExbD